MSTTLLQRESCVLDSIAEDEFFQTDQLDTEVQATLGYDQLVEDRAKRRQHYALMKTLVNLDIMPFTERSVETYKETCELATSRHLAEVVLLAFAFSFLVSLGAVAVLVFSNLFGFINVAFYTSVVFVVSALAAVVFGFLEARYGVERKWVMHELASYEEPIPEFALQTALDIKRSHPEVEFFVCTLEEDELIVDPFLVLRTQCGEEERDYYLEVWNESNFDGQREA